MVFVQPESFMHWPGSSLLRCVDGTGESATVETVSPMILQLSCFMNSMLFPMGFIWLPLCMHVPCLSLKTYGISDFLYCYMATEELTILNQARAVGASDQEVEGGQETSAHDVGF